MTLWLASVEEQGWAYDAEPAAADPATSLTLRKGPHLLRVQARRDRGFLLVQVNGPCLAATEDERAALERARRAEPIELI